MEKLVFDAGEEFNHIFSLNPEKFDIAKMKIEEVEGKIFKIGRVVSEKKIMIRKNEDRTELKYNGFNHFHKSK